MSVNPVHLAQACVGSAPGERGPLQLAEHPGDAAGVAGLEMHFFWW